MRLIALYGVLAVNLFAADFTPFDYDRTLPLDPHEHEISVLKGTRVALLNFAVTPSVRADGLLVTPPPGRTKTGAIVWVHSSGVFQQLPDAMLLAQAGAVSLLINPIGPNWDQPAAETWRGPMINAVVSIRRGVDLLLQRSDVDPQRLGFAGHSYGAMMGIDAVSSDRRFKAAVFEVGLPGMSVHLRTAPIPFAADIRKRLGPGLDSALSFIEPLDAIHYVGSLASIALLFQSAHLDPGVTDAQAQTLFDAASEPKTLKWYDTAHDVVDIAAISDRARFLATHLGLKRIDPILKAKIGVR
ncbi:MAG TPA: prolyl oligopeptidase family serine peptidase [Candidatus Acidoferrales bacterium]|nr:prolyl oligopeptidase family serine peptidase [Candidatus Acidoferrales bacterium]